MKKTIVVALGGNAISPEGRSDSIENQFKITMQTAHALTGLVKKGYNLVITHGNGPQVGNALLRVELSKGKVPDLPLYICVADVQGGMGFMIEQCLINAFKLKGIKKPTATLITQILVDKNDPSFINPTKFVGKFYTKEEVDYYIKNFGWRVKEVNGKGWRRVVPSPMPLGIINKEAIKELLRKDFVVIAVGGGGIPVCIDKKGMIHGVDAVIDKDIASAVLARDIEADEFLILTGEEKIYLNYGEINQKPLHRVTADELEKYYHEKHFPPGSMGPKVQAVLYFLKHKGKKAIITSVENAREGLNESRATIIFPD